MQSTPESGARAGYDGAKKKNGSKVHIAVDTLGHPLAVHVTPANEQERAQVAELAAQVQEATLQSVTLAYVDQGYTGDAPAEAAKEAGIMLELVKLPEAKRGLVLLPRRWVVERPFAWATRFRRLAKDYERLSETLEGLHFLVFTILMLVKAAKLLKSAQHPPESGEVPGEGTGRGIGRATHWRRERVLENESWSLFTSCRRGGAIERGAAATTWICNLG